MPPLSTASFAGFDSLAAYLDDRRRRDGLTQSALSEALGFPRNYIHAIYHGQFSPSRTRADRIARFFRDDPHLVRILAGLESPPPNLADRQLREINDLAAALSPEQRREAINYLKYLASRK